MVCSLRFCDGGDDFQAFIVGVLLKTFIGDLARSGDINTGLAFERMEARGVRAFPVNSNGVFSVQSEQAFTGLRIVNALGSVVLNEHFAPTGLRSVELAENGVFCYTLMHGAERIGSGRVVITGK